jgi:hypothetical protein
MVTALGNIDQHWVGATHGQVMMLERAAQTSGLDAHDRIEARVEPLIAIADADGDGVRLELMAAAGQRLLDREAQEPLQPFGAREALASKNSLDLCTNIFRARRADQTRVRNIA